MDSFGGNEVSRMDDFFRFLCPTCGKRLKAKPQHTGKKAHCNKCGTHLVVPTPKAHATSMPGPVLAAAPAAPQFYFIQNGQRFGPLTLKQMHERVTSHQLLPEHLVWREGTPQWVTAQEVSGLFPQAPAAVPVEEVPMLLPVDDPAATPAPAEHNCSHCKHRLPRWICGHPASAHYRRRIDPRDLCPHFDVNQAYAYYQEVIVQGARRATKGDDGDESLETEARFLETAIRMGLPEDDEASARFFLAENYRRLAVLRTPDATFIESLANSPLLAEALKQLEHSAKIDSARDYGEFASGPSRAMLDRFANAYQIVSRYIARTSGAEAAIAYLEEKLPLFQHVRGDPMWNMIFQLGCLYAEGRRDKEKAWAYFERVMHAETTRGCEKDQEKTREMARKNLAVLARSWDRDWEEKKGTHLFYS
jgi:hypothetical protein